MKKYISAPLLRHKADALLCSKNQLEQIVGAFCTMDADVVYATLQGVHRCNNENHDVFYQQLTDLFSYCEEKGDAGFRVFAGRCKNAECVAPNVRFYTFVANHTGNYINLKFDLMNGSVFLFKECCSIRTPLAMKPDAKLLYLSTFPF